MLQVSVKALVRYGSGRSKLTLLENPEQCKLKFTMFGMVNIDPVVVCFYENEMEMILDVDWSALPAATAQQRFCDFKKLHLAPSPTLTSMAQVSHPRPTYRTSYVDQVHRKLSNNKLLVMPLRSGAPTYWACQSTLCT